MSLLENKTQRFHSLRVPLANRVDYCLYTIRGNMSWIGVIWFILFVSSAVSLVKLAFLVAIVNLMIKAVPMLPCVNVLKNWELI